MLWYHRLINPTNNSNSIKSNSIIPPCIDSNSNFPSFYQLMNIGLYKLALWDRQFCLNTYPRYWCYVKCVCSYSSPRCTKNHEIIMPKCVTLWLGFVLTLWLGGFSVTRRKDNLTHQTIHWIFLKMCFFNQQSFWHSANTLQGKHLYI